MTMPPLAADDFPAFFQALHEYPPLDWQTRLAASACAGQWPALIDLPTGAGKTACLDIATFALALQADRQPQQRSAPLRTFLVVDRRIVVDDAFCRASKICKALRKAASDDSILGIVARRLLALQANAANDDAWPIEAVQLRGGIYRDLSWARSITQPLLVTSTVDQVGSRLLFRGYGVSDCSKPIHAALVGCDSLIILDEAHCSKPFAQTLASIADYQTKPWVAEPAAPPLVAVEMTATPSRQIDPQQRFGLTDQELQDRDTILGRRRFCAKPTELRIAAKATGRKAQQALATELVNVAKSLVSPARRAIAIVVNRVDTARAVHKLLSDEVRRGKGLTGQVELMIGRMRPKDRDDQAKRLNRQIASGVAAADRPDEPLFVVATQCIEVGADLDFDALVSEAAPLDALRQRFGRLNRTPRDIDALGTIVIQAANRKTDAELQTLEEKQQLEDPVYGNALARTFNALWEIAEGDDETRRLDFGIAALDQTVQRIGADRLTGQLTTTSSDAPVLLPAHLDLLCQTSPPPWPDPDVSLWLHGPRRADPQVNVCWRADLELPQDDKFSADRLAAAWTQAVSLCPPSSLECMPLPLRVVRQWLAESKRPSYDSADIPSDDRDDELGDEPPLRQQRFGLLWRGLQQSQLIQRLGDLRPGDTLVLPVAVGGWSELGFIPGVEAEYRSPHAPRGAASPQPGSIPAGESDPATDAVAIDGDHGGVDIAEWAFELKHQRKLIRLFRGRIGNLPSDEAFAPLRDLLANRDQRPTRQELRQAVAALLQSDAEIDRELWQRVSEAIQPRFRVDPYLDAQVGVVIAACNKTAGNKQADDDGDDRWSQRESGDRVALDDHLADVLQQVDVALDRLPLSRWAEALRTAARWHDIGKCDLRFQAMLVAGDIGMAYRQPRLWAKSDHASLTRSQWEAMRRRAQLPVGFRHEMLSMQLAQALLGGDDGNDFEPAGLRPAASGAQQRLDGDADNDLLLHLIAAHHGYARPWAPVCDDSEPPAVTYEDGGRRVELSGDWRAQHRAERVDSGVVARFWRVVRQFGCWGAAYAETVLRLADRQASARPTNLVQTTERLEETLV